MNLHNVIFTRSLNPGEHGLYLGKKEEAVFALSAVI